MPPRAPEDQGRHPLGFAPHDRGTLVRTGRARTLEIAGYEELKRVARRAGDEETVRTAERIIGEERGAAEAVRAQFEPVIDASLEAQGVKAA